MIPTAAMNAPIIPASLPLGDLRAGTLQVTLAEGADDVAAAQALRYEVFVTERGAKASDEMTEAARDFDHFDQHCDHLLVLEHAAPGPRPRVVGTYRLLRRENMRRAGRFYSSDEFDISRVVAHEGEIMELGRSCVHPEYRNRAVMQLLWRGIGAYVAKHSIELMFGCASFQGVDPKEHAHALSYLHHYHLAPESLRMTALPARYADMNLLPKDQIHKARGFASLPPLIKGYLRLGGYISDGAVIDHEYNTIDVGIVVKTQLVTEKYVQRYGGKETPDA